MKIHVDADERFQALANLYVTLHAEELLIYDEGITNA